MSDVWSKVTATTRVSLGATNSGVPAIKNKLAKHIEGVCGPDGYIKPGSVKILDVGVPRVTGGDLEYQVVYECEGCVLVDGMVMTVVARDITKAGIRATLKTTPSPIVVFVARDHHNTSSEFNAVKPGDSIRVKILGQRFELGDSQVSAIATLINA